MSRAVRRPKTKERLRSLYLEELNSTLAESELRLRLVIGRRVAREHQKEIDLIQLVREERCGVVPRQ